MSVLSRRSHGATIVFTVTAPRFDASLVPEFTRLFAEWTDPMPPDLALDLSGVRFVDSSALGALVAVYKSAAGSRMRLVGLTTPVLGLLKLTRLNRVFEIVEALEPAEA
ncbi:MAG: hypothetical protein RJA10_2974 [Pseudomonadota bacterium]|jgi:anti-sigma B factor antagonist